jgi:hypothetical protein
MEKQEDIWATTVGLLFQLLFVLVSYMELIKFVIMYLQTTKQQNLPLIGSFDRMKSMVPGLM